MLSHTSSSTLNQWYLVKRCRQHRKIERYSEYQQRLLRSDDGTLWFLLHSSGLFGAWRKHFVTVTLFTNATLVLSGPVIFYQYSSASKTPYIFHRFYLPVLNEQHNLLALTFLEEPLGLQASKGFGYFQRGPGLTFDPNNEFKLQAKLGFVGISSSVWLARDHMYDSVLPRCCMITNAPF